MRLSKYLTVELPDGFKPERLPSFNKWVNALESGEFPQTKEVLCKLDDNNNPLGYCCLGVLSRIQGRLSSNGSDTGYSCTQTLSISNPCYSVIGQSGDFPEGVTVYYKGKQKDDLADLNDSGAKFATVAKLIRVLWKPFN